MADLIQPTQEPASETPIEYAGAPLPTLFVGHGAPTLAVDPIRGMQVASISRSIPRPTSILAISAHWETRAPTIGAVQQRPLVYDFTGFPEALYHSRYPSPAATELSRRVEHLLRGFNVARAPERGLDHGVWVPLLHMYPTADIPVLQLSLPGRLASIELLKIGAALAPLRAEGVLIMGSGSLTHNLRLSRYEDPDPPPAWAVEFDQWVEGVLQRWDIDALADYRRRAPALHVAHPTEEHFLPLLVAAGAATVTRPNVRFPVTGFEHRALSRRSVIMD